MPIYEYECNECGIVTEWVCSIQAKPVGIFCGICSSYARSIISKPQAVRPQWDEYWDENLGNDPILVKGRRHRQEIMKARGLEEKPYDKTKSRIMIEKREHNKRERRI